MAVVARCSSNQVLSRRCGRVCSTSQEKHLFMNPHGWVSARGILNNPLTNWHHDSWCRWAHLYSPYFRLRRSRATASERAMVRARRALLRTSCLVVSYLVPRTNISRIALTIALSLAVARDRRRRK